MITSRHKDFFDRKLAPIARAVASSGVTPNQLTVLGLALGLASCLYLILTRNLLVFALLVLLFGLFDALDGLVARLTKQTSKFGSYLDAMCDRVFESCAVLAVAYVTGYWVPSFLVLSGAFLTSYAKARASMEVAISNTEWPDFFERVERSVLFVGGLFLSQVFPAKFLGHDLFFWTLAFLAAATHLTVLQRVVRARRIIRERSTG
jgi:phosphatidylglycerophosphate synthase